MVGKIQCRVMVYFVILGLHLFTMSVIIQSARREMQDIELQKVFSQLWNYITLWNLVIQVGYAIIGLICDIPVLMEITEKNSTLVNLRWYRSVLLYGIFWPCGFFIFIIFWPIYLYDRELVYPSVLDTAIGVASNHLMHTVILPIILWEFVFAEKRVTKPDKVTLQHLIGLILIYNIVMFATYYVTGLWPYSMMTMVYGSIYMVPLYVYMITMCAIAYYSQWILPSILKLNEKWYIQSVTK